MNGRTFSQKLKEAFLNEDFFKSILKETNPTMSSKEIEGLYKNRKVPGVYLVGGALRDELIGVESIDKDYCVTGLSKDEFIKLMGKTEGLPTVELQGKDFPVFRALIDGDPETEIALARKERKLEGESGYHSFETESDYRITIEEDLERRDLTFNAMARNVLTGDVVDLYNGKESIEKKEIKAIFIERDQSSLEDKLNRSIEKEDGLERGKVINGLYVKKIDDTFITSNFTEDPLRLYRAARFCSKYGFEIEDETKSMMSDVKHELKSLSSERVYEEMKKAINGKKPSSFFALLKDEGLLSEHFKEIDALNESDYHELLNRGDVDAGRVNKLPLIFSVLDDKSFDSISDRLRFSKKEKEQTIFLKTAYPIIQNVKNEKEEKVIDLIDGLSKHPQTKSEGNNEWLWSFVDVLAHKDEDKKIKDHIKKIKEWSGRLKEIKPDLSGRISGKEIGDDLKRRKKGVIQNMKRREELKEAFASERPSDYFRNMKEGELKEKYPEIAQLKGIPQPENHHPEGDVFEHTMQVLDEAARIADRENLTRDKKDKLCYAALLHDIGKSKTPEDEYPKHFKHERNGVMPAKRFSERIGVPKAWKEAAMFGALSHMKMHLNDMKDMKYVYLIEGDLDSSEKDLKKYEKEKNKVERDYGNGQLTEEDYEHKKREVEMKKEERAVINEIATKGARDTLGVDLLAYLGEADDNGRKKVKDLEKIRKGEMAYDQPRTEKYKIIHYAERIKNVQLTEEEKTKFEPIMNQKRKEKQADLLRNEKHIGLDY